MAATDAKEFSDFWANSNFSSLNKIVPRLFINQTATSSTLKANLLDMQTTSTAADWVCMYIQTKYELSPEGKPFLQMFDTDPMGRESSFISVPALTNMIQLIPGKKWIVLDIFKETPTSEEMLELRKNLVSELSENIDDMIVLIPCLPMEASQDDPSVFMEILLEAMKGMADTDKDRAISMTEIRAYIEKNVPLQTQDQQHPLFIENSPLNFLLLQKNP
jgi:hypothetical protein